MADANIDLKGVFRLPTPSGMGDIPSKFTVQHTATPIALFAKFEVQLINDLFAEVTVRQTGTAALFSELIVSQDLEENLFAELVVRHPDTATLFAKFLPRVELAEDLKAVLDVGQNSEDLVTYSLISGLGNVLTEPTSRDIDRGYILGSKFTMGPSLAVGSKIVFWYSPDSIINYARGAIYTVSGNVPGTLIEETELSGALSGEGWKELSFTDRPILEASTEYFLLVWLNRATGAEVRYRVTTLQGYTKNMGSAAVGSFSSYDPMPGGAARSYRFSIYAIYDLATNGTADLFAEFEVAQGSGDIAAKFLLRQQTGDLKATFTLPETEDLFAEFIVAQDSEALFSYFEAQVSQNLFAKFTVNHDFYADLFCEIVLYMPYSDLYAKILLIGANTKELYAKFTVYNGATEQLFAKFLPRFTGTEDLLAEFTVRSETTVELFAKFDVCIANDLKATFYISTNPNAPSYYPIIDSEFVYWMNYNQVAGRGFIGFPTYEDDAVDYAVPPNSLKISADRVQKGYKEFTFGWLYEGVDLRYWQRPPCVDGKEYNRLIHEDWTGYEETTIDWEQIEKDTYVIVEYYADFGAGGIYHQTEKHGTDNDIRLSSFNGYMPGDFTWQNHRWYNTVAMKWSLAGLSGLDLTRFAWARIEMYRYASTMLGGALKIYRMPDCDDVDERGSPALYGGCRSDLLTYPYSSTGSYPGGIWSEASADYHVMGINHINHSFNRVNGNASFYADPDDGIGFSWDNLQWDMVDLSTLMLGWLDGTYNNHGLFVYMYQNKTYFDYKGFNDYIQYYSREASGVDDYKPLIRVMLEPTNQKWTFQNQRKWDINTDDPYSGSACLRLKDWSKANYSDIGSIHGGRPGVTLTGETPSEGMIETQFRLNSRTARQVNFPTTSPGATPGYGYYVEAGPRDNYLNVYFRYQDSSNHYRIEINPTGTSCRIIREVSGVETVLNTFSGNFKAAEWNRIRVAYALTSDGDLKLCCWKLNADNRWSFLAGFTETGDPYWPDGGEVMFESLDSDLDETDVWEVQ